MYSTYIKEIGRGARASRDLGVTEAKQLFAAMLDGGVPELELGAIILALRMKTESVSELLGFYEAVRERVTQLTPPNKSLRPVILPAYNGSRRQANLMPLLALLLARLGITVLVQGSLESEGRVTSAAILRDLGVLPSANVPHLEEALARDHIAFAPIGLLCPGLAELLALRARLGVRNSAHTLAKLIDPFSTHSLVGGLRMLAVTHPAYADKLRSVFVEGGPQMGSALLMRGTEGEAVANARRRPQIDWLQGGVEGTPSTPTTLFEAEHGSVTALPSLPDEADARSTAAWIRRALDGEHAIPSPILNQAACCLYASGATEDLNQAKAMVAVHARVKRCEMPSPLPRAA